MVDVLVHSCSNFLSLLFGYLTTLVQAFLPGAAQKVISDASDGATQQRQRLQRQICIPSYRDVPLLVILIIAEKSDCFDGTTASMESLASLAALNFMKYQYLYRLECVYTKLTPCPGPKGPVCDASGHLFFYWSDFPCNGGYNFLQSNAWRSDYSTVWTKMTQG